MLLFTVLLLLLSGVCKAMNEQDEKFKNEILEYGKKFGISWDDVERVFKNGLNGADENFKCFIASLVEDSYKFNDDGAFDAETTIANVRGPAGLLKDNAIKALRACSDTRGNSKCDAFFNVYKCTVENVKKLFNAKDVRRNQ